MKLVAVLVAIASILIPANRASAAPDIRVMSNFMEVPDGQAVGLNNTGTYLGEVDVDDTDPVSSLPTWITLFNTGDSDLTISALTFGGAHSADFTADAPLPPIVIAPGGSRTIVIHFNPSSTGLRTATFHIFSDDPSPADYDFVVEGTGVTGPIPQKSEIRTVLSLTTMRCKDVDGVIVCKIKPKVYVANDGPVEGAPHYVDFYWSPDYFYNVGDPFLGRIDVLKPIKPFRIKKVKARFDIADTPDNSFLSVTANMSGPQTPEYTKVNNRFNALIDRR